MKSIKVLVALALSGCSILKYGPPTVKRMVADPPAEGRTVVTCRSNVGPIVTDVAIAAGYTATVLVLAVAVSNFLQDNPLPDTDRSDASSSDAAASWVTSPGAVPVGVFLGSAAFGVIARNHCLDALESAERARKEPVPLPSQRPLAPSSPPPAPAFTPAPPVATPSPQ